jgi:hypothetical protein
MARKRRMSKVAFNQGLVMDGVIAMLVVQKAPELLNRFLLTSNPVTGLIATAAGVGAGYLGGSFFKRPQVANLSIAAGIVEYAGALIDDIVGGVTGDLPMGVSPSGQMVKVDPAVFKSANVSDYLGLNDYSQMPRKQNWADYYNSY